jgi:CheY-like chemotaxis protein
MEPNLYVATRLLKLYRLRIDTAMSGRVAIGKIKSGKSYDLIFMDHMMPDMDGIETTKQLRELGYTQPIIALTANAVVGQADVFLQNGFDEFISKPIDIHQLDNVLNKYIHGKNEKKQIFIVDDDGERLNASASVLETDYRVMTMLSIGKVFILMEKKKPDIIIMNGDMSGTNGQDFINRLKERPEWRDIPVILLEKSYDPKNLPDVVREHIG